jgi:hypothetical protein
MIIGLTGYAQSGKDTVAKVLVEQYGYIRVAFADRIRDFLFESNPMFDSVAGEPKFVKDYVIKYGWEDAKKNPQIRRLLQNVGVAARNIFGEEFWIDQAMRQLDPDSNYVITDVRFINEADALRQMGRFIEGLDVQLWRIKRAGVEAVNDHVSEHELDGYKVDQIFTNNGTVEDLELMIKTRMMAYAKSE